MVRGVQFASPESLATLVLGGRQFFNMSAIVRLCGVNYCSMILKIVC